MKIDTNTIIDAMSRKLSVQLELISSSRDNIVLKCKTNTQVVRISLSKSISDVLKERQLISFLKDQQALVPTVLHTDSIEVHGKHLPFMITSYIDHIPAELGTLPSEDAIKQAARQLSIIHQVTQKYVKNHTYTQSRTLISDIEKLHTTLIASPSPAANVGDIVCSLEWALKFYNDQEGSVEGCIVHNDYRQQNVLFDANSQLLAVIDFDWSVYSPSYYKDVAHGALEWSYLDNTTIDKNRYQLFITSYEDAKVDGVKLDHKYIYDWARFSALADASYYFLSHPERTSEKFKSYMYDKFLYLTNNEA